MPRPLLRILSAIQEHPWAITSEGMELMLGILETNMAGHGQVDLEAVAEKIGRPLENTGGRVTMRGETAVIDINGPIFRYADLFTEVSGATSVERLSTDLRAALDNPAVSQILLNIDSPGGQVNGVQELADRIRAGAAEKPITAYIDGMGASGAYWIASAASRIVASESSLIGSIGVVLSVTDRRDAQERQGVKRYEIVSTLSPLKRADVRTDEGKAQLLAIADSLAEIFVGRVARFRGTTPENVAAKYGRGAIMVASQAAAAGMVDEVAAFEPLLARLQTSRGVSFPGAASAAQSQEVIMADVPVTAPPPAPLAPPAATLPAAASAPSAPPAETIIQAERTRCQAILTCEEATGRTDMARHLAFQTSMSAADAQTLLKVAPKVEAAAPAPAKNPLDAAMANAPNPKVGAGTDAGENTVEAEAASILRFVPKARRAS